MEPIENSIVSQVVKMTFEEVIARVRAYAPRSDIELLRRAYAFSSAAHEGQLRQSGEPYLHHPLEVAGILTQLKLDIPSLVAGLLHDVLEDTAYTRETLAREFGDEIATLVDGVTKIDKIEFRSDQEKQAENFRKMVVAMAEDIRVVLIKLADRLHNMRTLQALSEERQRWIAQETLDIYAPLANRLGIGWMKAELEDLSLRYLKPAVYQALSQKVKESEGKQDRYIQSILETIRQSLQSQGVPCRVSGRVKHLYGIYQKMGHQGIPFEEVYDLIGVRIITDTKMHCYAVLGLIHALWRPVEGRFKDHIAIPKSNLYQTLHTTVAGPEGRHVEFQIRTQEMHRIAEEGIASHWVYKEGGQINAKDERIFAWLRQLVEWHQEFVDTRQFMESVKTDLFSDVVYVFTPKGHIKELIKGATTLDFAYAVHTDVGSHCVGTKVNGKIVPLTYSLRSGDTVEVLISATQKPSKDWLKIVKTPRAKAKIKHLIRESDRIRSLEIGRKIIERELRRARLNVSEAMKSEGMLPPVKEMGIHTLEELFIAVGYGKVSAQHVVRPLLPESKLQEGLTDKLLKRVGFGSNPVHIKGLDDILIVLSKCCNPVPGDRIIGYVTRGRGLSIHTVDCPNIDELDYNRDRLMDVTWEKTQGVHAVEIGVLTVDQPGLLGAVSTAIAQSKVNITRADISTTEDKKASLRFMIEVNNVREIEKVLKNIEKVEGVIQARRIRTGQV